MDQVVVCNYLKKFLHKIITYDTISALFVEDIDYFVRLSLAMNE